MKFLVFLKLGGSLITNKSLARTPKNEVINRLTHEIRSAIDENPNLQLVIGHGSGSFGHFAANKYRTQQGVSTPSQWIGFSDVWHEAHLLNQLVIESLVFAGLPVLSFPPSASAISEDGILWKWDISALKATLQHHLIPVVNGDVTFDIHRGGTILSTEDVFSYLAPRLQPNRILLAGIEPGVWADYPICSTLIPTISSNNLETISPNLLGSAAIDVTGGMAQKVTSMLDLTKIVRGLEITIFSGKEPGNLRQALLGAAHGTVIKAE